MPGTVSFELRGARDLEEALKELGPGIANNLGAKAVRAAAKPIVKEAKLLVPVRTGALKKSITAVKEKARGGKYAASQTVLIGFKPPASAIAHLVEFGTSRTRAHPFMRPALDNKAGEALKVMQETLATGILRQEWKKTLSYLAEGGEIDWEGEGQ